jgi:hypothetical protein
MKEVFILAAANDAIIGKGHPRDNIIATFTTQELAEFYQKVYGLTFCTTIFPLKRYTNKEQITK